MGLKKAELYRGFNIFTEEVRAGSWRVAVEMDNELEAAGLQPKTAHQFGGATGRPG
jgi:hypothetical protein